jgi:hypothetical protein
VVGYVGVAEPPTNNIHRNWVAIVFDGKAWMESWMMEQVFGQDGFGHGLRRRWVWGVGPKNNQPTSIHPSIGVGVADWMETWTMETWMAINDGILFSGHRRRFGWESRQISFSVVLHHDRWSR